MAIVRRLERITLENNSNHSEANCTYSVINGPARQRLLQIDTYGSALRQFPGKKSQSIRFSPEAIEQLKEIIKREL